LEGYVAYTQLSEQQLTELLKERLVKEPGYMIREKREDIEFLHAEPNPWEAGRLFSDKDEIRWRLNNSGIFDVHILSESKELPKAFTEVKEFEVVEQEEARLYLVGRRRQGQSGWVEAKIPREIIYPVDKDGEVAIKFLRYVEKGRTKFLRFKGLEVR